MPNRLRAAFLPPLLGGYLAGGPNNSIKAGTMFIHQIYAGKRSRVSGSNYKILSSKEGINKSRSIGQRSVLDLFVPF